MPRHAARHRAETPRRRRLIRLGVVVATSLALVVGIGVSLVYRKLDGNLEVVDTDALIGDDRPDAATGPRKPLNVLLIGSDSRTGTDVEGAWASGLSDTTILLHISGDRTRAYGVSIPRDSMVERPTCIDDETGAEIPASNGLEMFNAAFAYGGPACTIKTVESMTDIRINHFVEVNFNGFRDMVDALDGVPICVPEEVNDTYGKIYLPAGSYVADGDRALDYVRTRTAISNNGDIGRMRRQQAFLAAMTNKAVSLGTLANPVKLYNFLDAATSSIRLDERLDSPAKLAGLAKQLTDIGLDNVQFLSVPFEQWEVDRNRLIWTEEADVLWERIRNDEPLSRRLSTEAISAAAPPVESAGGSSGGSGESEAEPESPATPDEQARAEAARENGLCA